MIRGCKRDSLTAEILLEELAVGRVERHVQKHLGLPRPFRTYRQVFVGERIHFVIKGVCWNEMIDQTQLICATAIDVIAGKDHPFCSAEADITGQAERAKAG